ncbi:histidine kinase dimerization/phosphoacceptor domain -containing protein [Winogradskyella psychrotolerans]|uniref:histidine kinase dimerization/phosphoacceptor domain -containing protein n=1 Tax=Winogradskyella psychrotolerans TaxID=1344585 RepID=UPI001C07B99E|nr:histidine kinase dimerization/phosphoacceptor domain -containing protein [Winogradskyella psychrotolerans]MBU2926971.1 tetratricopeptide repeat protein [Winogradskyella psychrotolerans]
MKQLLYLSIVFVFLVLNKARGFEYQTEQHPSQFNKKTVQNYIDKAWEYTIRENDSALIYAKKALQFSRKNNYPYGEALAIESQGLYHEIVTGNYDLASKFYFEGIKFCEENNLTYASSLYHSLGIMFHTSDNYEKALEYYNIAYERATNDNDAILQKRCLVNIGSIYSSLEEYDKAKATLLQGLDIDVNRYIDYNIYANLGNLLIRQQHYKEAISYLEKAVVVHPDNKDSETNLMYLLEAKAALKDSIGMQPKIKRAVAEAERISSLRNKSHLYDALSKYFYAFEDFKIAADYQQKYHAIFVEIKEKQRDQTVYDLETKYQTEKTNRELENKTFNEKLFIISLIFLGILLTLVTFYYIKNRKKNRLLDKQKTLLESTVEDKNFLLKEIHHRVKNNLQVISSLLSLQQRQISDVKASQAMQEGRDRVKAMALIHQNLYQDTDLIGVQINDYVKKLANSLVKNYQTENKPIQLNLDVDTIKLDIDTIIPLGLVINELISNALKYAFTEQDSGTIDIHLKHKNNSLTLVVTDNGKGLPEGFDINQISSLGFRLIKAFSDKLKADLRINSSKQGTEIHLDIPNITPN